MNCQLRSFVGLIAFAAFLPAIASAQVANSSFGASVHLLVGQTPVRASLANAGQAFYDVPVVSTRSYCAEATASDTEQNATQASVLVFKGDKATNVGTEGNMLEPRGLAASRICFIAPTTDTYYIQLTNMAAGTVEYSLRFVETTLWSNWAYTGCCGYQAYSILRNTTNTPLSIDLRFFDTNGNQLGARLNQNVAANGVYYVNSGDVVGQTVSTVQVAHAGSPEAIVGSETTLSAATGLSFDTLFFQRKPW